MESYGWPGGGDRHGRRQLGKTSNHIALLAMGEQRIGIWAAGEHKNWIGRRVLHTFFF